MLHAHVFGDPADPPLVGVPGVRGHGARWRRLAEAGRRVIGLDPRGHGLSTWDPPWSLERFATDVLSTMDGRGMARADLVGHSFGGAVGVYVARTAPERVRRLVLVDPAVGIRPDIAGRFADAAMVAPVFESVAEAVRYQAGEWPDVPSPVIDEEVAANLARGGDGRYRFRWRPAAVAAIYSELSRDPVAPPPSVPTLILRAPREKIVRRGFLAACAEAGSDVTLTDIDCGHMMLEERPDEVVAAVRNFLSSP